MPLSRREFTLGALSSTVLAKKKVEVGRPNIVLIVGENLAASALGCYGNKNARTPNIDLLAREGTRFRHYAAAPAVAEGRRTLVTGRMKDGTAISDILAGQGYNCGQDAGFVDQQTAAKPFFVVLSYSGDDQLPALVSKIDKLGLRDNTAIVFTSTNGLPGTSEMHEDAVATPMIWNWPGRVPVEGARPELVASYDLAPTICEAAGVAAPAGMCGRSYFSLVTNKPMPKKHPWPTTVFAALGSTQMARDKRYKVILRNGGKGPNEFYDEVADPIEKVNQDGNPRFNSMRADLAAELAAWVRRCG